MKKKNARTDTLLGKKKNEMAVCEGPKWAWEGDI